MTPDQPLEDRVEQVAMALFDCDEQDDKLVRIGMLLPRTWDQLPDDTPLKAGYLAKARAAVEAIEGEGLTREQANALLIASSTPPHWGSEALHRALQSGRAVLSRLAGEGE